MFIEDLIHRLAGSGQYMFQPRLQLFARDEALISSFSSQLDRGYSFSEKQADLAVKFCKKYKEQLALAFGKDIQPFLDNPKFALSTRKLATQTKHIEIINEPTKAIKVTFPYDEKLVQKIRSWKEISSPDTANWDQESKSWIFSLTETSISYIRDKLLPQGFSTCEKFAEFLAEIDKISEKFEDFVPRLTLNDGIFSYANTHPSIPQPTSKDLLENLFVAKRYGISCWDESIDFALNHGNFSALTMKFLNSNPRARLDVDASTNGIEIFDDIVKHATPCLVIIPPGSEIASLKKWWGYLESRNFEKKQVSVMFRTDNGNERMFNELVRDYGLNNPIDENTKFVFVSQKLPKPVIKSGIKFNCAINLGSINGVHYTLNSFLHDFPDIVVYNNKGTQGNTKWQTVK